jgi:hypothetical protein
MVRAAELQQLSSSLWLCQAFDPAVKADLFSTVVRSGGQLFVIDPIPLEGTAFEKLDALGKVKAILVTNANHMRAVEIFAKKYDVAVFADAVVACEFSGVKTSTLGTEQSLEPEFTHIPIAGAALGETTYHFPADAGTMVVGDALINLEPYGFALLPEKYCADQKKMRGSLRQLLDWPFERLFFAHGTPLLRSARARLEMLLR